MSQFPLVAVPAPVLWEKLSEQTLLVAAAAITFSGLDPAFTFLRLTCWGVLDANTDNIDLTFNNDAGFNYDKQYINANGVTTAGARSTGSGLIQLYAFSVLASEEFSFVVTVAKPVAGEEAQVLNLASSRDAAVIQLDLTGGQWNNTADLVNRIDIKVTNTMEVETRILLEGAKPA